MHNPRPSRPKKPRQNRAHSLNDATLAVLRRRSERRDAEDAALKSLPDNRRQSGRGLFATTLPQLRERLGDYGDAAVVDGRLRAVQSWAFFPEGPSPTLPVPRDVAGEAMSLCIEEVRYATGLPDPEGRPRICVMRRLGTDLQEEARSVASALVRQWEAAGCPGLTPERITRTHQYFNACIKFQKENPA